MRGNHVVTLVLIAIVGVFVASDCAAAIYKYEDKEGMINFADNLQSIPAQYRTNAKIVSGEPEDEKKPPVRDVQTTQAEKQIVTMERGETPMQAHNVPDDNKQFSRKALISVIAVMSVLFLFALLKVFDADHAKSVKIARIVLMWGISVYMIWAHYSDVIQIFTSAGTKIESVQQQAEEKGRKAAKAVKALDALMEQAEKGISSDQVSQGSEDKKDEKVRN